MTEIRWHTLAALAVIVPLLAVGAEIGGVWFGFPARPDWLWILAFSAALRATPARALLAFASCGFLRDVFLGPRLGAGVIAYVLIGWALLSWRTFATERSLLTAPLLAGATAFLAALLRHSLDFGFAAYTLADRVFFVSAGDGLLTGLLYLPFVLILHFPPLCPWQERSGL